MNKVLMTIHGGVRSYRQYWGGNQVIYLNDIYRNTVPFYVENITNSNETLSIVKNNSNAPDITIEKSSDGEVWTTLGTTSTTALTQTIQPGERLYLRASANVWCILNGSNYYNRIRGVSKVGGNIMSLLYGSSFGAQDTFPTGSIRTFYRLFYDNTNLQDASGLILPATILANYCYMDMFRNCTSLTTAPILPATTLTISCYNGMFYGCSSLTAAPALPATTLTNYCYQYMFQNCTSLTTAPTLPATTLTTSCYNNMFNGCTSLTSAPELPATTLKNYCYGNMFNGCSNLTYIKCLATNISATNCTANWVTGVAAYGIFEKAPNMSSWTTGVNGIPSGWNEPVTTPFYVENITNSNETLTIKGSNDNQFDIYASLDNINWEKLGTTGDTLITKILEPGDRLYLRANTNSWGYIDPITTAVSKTSILGVSSVGGNSMSLLYGSNFTGHETTFPSNAKYVLYGLFLGTGNENLLKAGNMVLPAATLTEGCYSSMFMGCRSLLDVPALPAKQLTSHCYYSMFQACNSLNTIKCLATDISADWCTVEWSRGVTANGTFIKDANMSDWTTGYNGIPSGWTVQDV